MKFLLLLLALLVPTELVSVYREGEVRKTTIHLESMRTLTESESAMNGKPFSQKPLGVSERKRTLDATLLDTVQRVKGQGRPVSLLRKYSNVLETFSDKTGPEKGAVTTSESSYPSELEGKQVLFKGSAGRLKGHFPKGTEGDRKLLKAVESELPWRSLLPKGKVKEGSTWKVDVEAVWRLLTPGGDLAFEYTDVGDLDVRRKAVAGIRSATELDGKVTATLRKIDGGQATIGLAIAFTESADTTRETQATNKEMRAKLEKGQQMAETLSSGFEREYKGTGELVWDTHSSRPVSLELELETHSLEFSTSRLQFDKDTFDQESRGHYEGTLKVLIEQEPQVQ